MAAIDKIYGNNEMYNELNHWCENNISKVFPDWKNYFYDDRFEDGNYDKNQYPICNLPMTIEYYLLGNCNIDWVVEDVCDRCGLNNLGDGRFQDCQYEWLEYTWQELYDFELAEEKYEKDVDDSQKRLRAFLFYSYVSFPQGLKYKLPLSSIYPKMDDGRFDKIVYHLYLYSNSSNKLDDIITKLYDEYNCAHSDTSFKVSAANEEVVSSDVSDIFWNGGDIISEFLNDGYFFNESAAEKYFKEKYPNPINVSENDWLYKYLVYPAIVE